MQIVTRSLLDAILIAMSRIPGRRALLLLPAAALYGRLDPEFLRAKADSAAHATAPPHSAAVSTKDQPPAVATSTPEGGLGGMMSKLLGPNEFASGGLMLMLIGAAAAGARSAVSSGLRYCRRHVMVTAEIDSRDDAYRWVMHWLSQHPKFRNSSMVSVTTNLNCFGTAVAQWPLGLPDSSSSTGDSSVPPVSYLPAPGDHLFRYQGRWMRISRARNTAKQSAANARLLLETMTISMIGTDRSPLDALLSEAAASYHQSQSSRTAVHSCDADGYWSQVGSRPIRPINTVVLPEGQAESLLTDCREFLASEEWYAHHGIPYRRGYLLYGPPGTGKTSLVMAVAGALGLDIYVITLSSPTMTDETLRQLLNTAGTKSVLLLEDVDAAFLDRTAAAGTSSSRLTFSGLLNAIDGVAAQEGRLLFMTTNHIERLSNALIRPGRVDVRYYLGPATVQQARDLFVSFYQDLPHLLLQPLAVRRGLAGKGAAAAAAAAAAGSRPEHLAATGADLVVIAARAGETSAGVTDVPAQQPSEQQSQQQHSLLARSGSKSQSAASQEAAAREVVLQDLASKFAAELPEGSGVSMAQLQGYLMTYRKDPWRAAANVQQLLQQQQQQQQQQEQQQQLQREEDDKHAAPAAD